MCQNLVFNLTKSEHFKKLLSTLQKVCWWPLGHIRLWSISRLSIQSIAHILLIINLTNGCLIPASITIVRGRKDCNDLFIMMPGIPIHHQLMRSGYHIQTILVQEIISDITSELITSRPWTRAETSFGIIRIRP